jgi:hypothetical protein
LNKERRLAQVMLMQNALFMWRTLLNVTLFFFSIEQ